MTHIPVMVAETIRYLLHESSRVVLDGTVGCGGHAKAVLESRDDITLIGLDRDEKALLECEAVLSPYKDRVRLRHGNYADLRSALANCGPVDGVLLDLGVSGIQIDTASRGFSYSQEGPLDMRMSGETVTARALIETSDVDGLAKVLREYGEIRGARRIAHAIRVASQRGTMTTTIDLKNAVDSALRGKASPALLSKVFQAIRIALNEELINLRVFLDNVLEYLGNDARVVITSYHSLEDRMIKDFFRRESTACLCPPNVPQCVCGHVARLQVLTRRVVKPSTDEIRSNPRSRSARLRAARFVA